MYETIQKNNAFFRQLIFLGVLFFLGAVLIKQLGFFIGSFLGAITMYIVLRGILFNLTEKHHWKRWTASLLLVGGATIILLGLGFLVFEIAASRIGNVNTTGLLTSLSGFASTVSAKIGFELSANNIFNQSSSMIQNIVSAAFNTTYSFAINIFLMLVILFFMLMSGRKMEEKAFEYIPFHGESLTMLKTETKNMIYSNAVGIPLIMITQGISTYIIMWLLGVPNAILWAFLTALCGLIPMIGTAIVTVPMGAFLISQGHVVNGIILIFCGLFVIANVDNLARIVLLKKATNTHPLVVIFGVIMGIPLFGFWGIIFGPLFISSFLLLIKIYYREYKLIYPSTKTEPETKDKS